ncbi:MAG: HAD-IC family P-type ATPase, partial [Cellulomonas sp.]|nr:HAD-IC family P-type ATPase [Cellulomonas sp.]
MSTVAQSPVVPYAAPPGEVLAALGSNERGLSSDDAARRLAEVGPNRLPEPPRRHPVLRFLAHFDDVLIYILLAAAVLKAILGEWVDFAVILVVAVVNALVGYVQEGRAASALAGIATMLSVDAQALRDGAWQHVDAQSVVPGDVVRVRSGDRVPADVRLLEAVTLQVDEAALTGESLPAAKDVAAVAADAGVGDRTSMLFSGTIVAAGRGVAVVTATGAGTEIGRIQALVTGAGQHLETPLTRQLARLGKQLSLTILGMAAVMLVIGRVVHAFALDELVSAAIGFAVAAVPEGLPALVTITLALGVQQMARRHAITRRLPAVEGLGSVTTICSDKTGTLTKNEMTASTVVTGGATYTVEGLGYEPTGRVLLDGAPAPLREHDDLAAMTLAFLACADARLVESGGRWTVVGQPTEGALVALARKAGADADRVVRLAQVPFESSNKLSATLDEHDGVRAVHVVGAPDRLLDRATTELRGGVAAPLDRARWDAVVDDLGGRGLRVLAAARRPAPGEDGLSLAAVGDELELLGLVGIVDPPRPEAVQAIADCHAAGIHV